MTESLKKNGGWLFPLLLNLVVAAGIYMHSLSVKAAIVTELKEYVTKEDLASRDEARKEWFAEAFKTLNIRIDSVNGNQIETNKRLERMENRRFRIEP